MNGLGMAPHEQLAISMAKKLGKDHITIPVLVSEDRWDYVATTFCGTCGRIAHHPDCSVRPSSQTTG
jgi:hypothetical protein